MDVLLPRPDHLDAIIALAEQAMGPERAQRFVRAHLEDHHLLVASHHDEVAGFVAYRIDWFECTFVTLVFVREDMRRLGIARALFRAVEDASPSPRLFSSTEDTNATSSQMHGALGFTPPGHVANRPQG